MKVVLLCLMVSFEVSCSDDLQLLTGFLEKHCYDCHNPEKKKADLDFTIFKKPEDFFKVDKKWHLAKELVLSGEMPEKKVLLAEEIQQFVTQLELLWERNKPKLEDWFGRQPLKRLSPAEINHSLSDIAQLDLELEGLFPVDGGGGEGFRNNSDTMHVSPLFMEKLYQAAEQFVSHLSFRTSHGLVFHGEANPALTNEQYTSQNYYDKESFYSTRSTEMTRHEMRWDFPKYVKASLEMIYIEKETNLNAVLEKSKREDLVAGALHAWLRYFETPKKKILNTEGSMTWENWSDWVLQELEPLKSGSGNVSIEPSLEAINRKITYFLTDHSLLFTDYNYGQLEKIKIDSSKKLRINVGTAGDGNEFDFVNIHQACFVLKNGEQINLKDCEMVYSQGNVCIDKNGKNQVAKSYVGEILQTNIIGFQAPAQVIFKIPNEAESFVYGAHMDHASEGKAFVQIVIDQDESHELLETFVTKGHPFSGPGPKGAEIRAGADVYSLILQYFFYPTKEFIDLVLSDQEKAEIEGLKKETDFLWQLNAYNWKSFYAKHQIVETLTEEALAKRSAEFRQAYEQQKKDIAWFRGMLASKIKSALQPFARQLYRRSLKEDELDDWVREFFSVFDQSGQLQESVRFVVRSMILHPAFIYKLETQMTGAVDAATFVNRLSYFLWASGPDEELLKLVEHDEILKPEILRQQISRMLKDKKSQRLGKEFFSYWLQINRLCEDKQPNHELFPVYSTGLNQALIEEVMYFCYDFLNSNQPVINLINSEDSFLNQRLAEYYGVEGIEGTNYRKVKLSSQHRGGLLGMAAIHTVSSYSNRTSPVLRGQWILEVLLGTPVPPPPENVELAEFKSEKVEKAMTIKARLELHRQDSRCAVCHDRMDPLGFSLENFNAIGQWREQESGLDIDTLGVLKNGKKIEGVQGLRQYLSHEMKESFVHQFTSKLLGFALGRALDYPDEAIVQYAMEKSKPDDYRIKDLIYYVVDSPAFRLKREHLNQVTKAIDEK